MSRYSPFKFIDCLSDSARGRIAPALHVTGDNDPEILLIIRMLSGCVDFKYGDVGRVIKQRTNYFSPSFTSMGNSWGKKFPRLISEGVTHLDIGTYIQDKKYTNKGFYREILFEISNFFLHKSRGSHTSAFIYLYRLLERISYCFPLIYVSMTDDFKKTYNLVKSFFGESKDKDELGFFKTFIDTIFKDDEVLQTNVDFDFEIDGRTAEDAKRLCSTVKSILSNDFKGDGLLTETVVSVRYDNVGRFIISIRNGFFHNLSRKNNLDAENLRDSDLLFELINDKCLYWISSVFLAIFSYNLSAHNK